MIFYLDKTNYQEFDAWLCNKAKQYKFRVSYDEIGLIDDLGNLDVIPKKIYPLRIFLSKIYAGGVSYDQDMVFIIEKVGERLKICPKSYQRGFESSKFLLLQIADDWPKTREIIMREVFKIILEPKNEIINTKKEGIVIQSNNHKISPNRLADLRKWRAVWNYIEKKHWVKEGVEPGKIIDFLVFDQKHKHYNGFIFSVETLKKIIRAGEAGEFS